MSSLDSSSDAILLDDIADEFVRRQREGENPTIDEYVEKHPKLEEHIRPLLATLQRVEIARPESDSSQPFPGLSGADGTELKQLGDYRILREIGRGGMGVVFEAEQVSLGRRVALKALPQASQLDPRQFARFQLEARATARLEHPHIVPIHGVGEDDNLHYFTMQFIDGPGLGEVLNEVRLLRNEQRTLSEESATSGIARVMQSGTLSEAVGDQPQTKEAESTVNLAASDTFVSLSDASRDSLGTRYFHNVARIGVQIASALEFAHSHGILHRDVKPSNILLDLRGKAWITDFGLAKADDAADVTHTGDIVGTLRYMAPERFEGWADIRSDVYSLGLTLYELATLQPAFGTGDRATLIQRIREADPPLPRAIDSRIPRDLETIILKAIAAEPAQRYRTAGQLGEDLERFLAGQPIRARRTSTWEKARLWTRRNPAIATLLISLFLVLTAGFATSTWYWHKATQQAADLASSERKATELSRIASDRAAEAEESRVTAEQQRDVALSKSRDLRVAVDQLFTAIADDPLLKTVGLEKFRRSMLERANQYYDEFHNETPDDPGLAFEHAQLTYKLADMNRQLGDLKAAKRLYTVVVDTVDNSAAPVPSLFEVAYRSRLMMAECSWRLGEPDDQLNRLIDAADRFLEMHSVETAAKFLTECAHMAVGVRRVNDAWTLSNRADELWEKIEPKPDEQRQHDMRIALHLTTRSRLALELAEYEEARLAASRVAGLLEPYGPSQLVSATNADMDYLIAVSYSHQELFAKSTKHYRRAAEVIGELQQAHPDVLTYRVKLMNYKYHLALNLHRQDQHQAALELLNETFEAIEENARQFPDVSINQRCLRGDTLNVLSGVHARLGNFEKQGQFTQMAIDTLQKVREETPYPMALIGLGSAWMHRADYFANINAAATEQRNAYEQAIDVLEQLLHVEPKHQQATLFLAQARLGQAELYLAVDDKDSARRLFQQVIDLEIDGYTERALAKMNELDAAP